MEYVDTRKVQPQFERMLLAASQRKFDLLLFWALDLVRARGRLCAIFFRCGARLLQESPISLEESLARDEEQPVSVRRSSCACGGGLWRVHDPVDSREQIVCINWL